MSPTNDYGGVAEAARFQPKRSVTVLLLPVTAHLGGTQIFLWAVVIGSGCALILWLTVSETLFQMRTHLHQEDILPLPGL